MKLRTDGRSIRLRLRRSEVEALAAFGAIVETIPFPGRPLRFSLEASGVEPMAASFDGASIRVTVPPASARRWADSEETGIYGFSQGIEIAIEKDFRRMSRPSSDDADRYPNPNAAPR
jgi:hypothetical protein